MSQEEYDTLARSSPPAPFDLASRDLEEDFGALTRPPTAHRSESLPNMSAWQRASSQPGRSPSTSGPAISSRRGVGLTAPSRRNSDMSTNYNVAVPRAPAVPALTIPNMQAQSTHVSSDAVVSTERPTPFGARAQLEDRSVVLRHAISIAKATDLAIDHRAGFLLSLIDGKATIEELLDVCPMPEDDVLAVLASLVVSGVVVIGR